MVDDSVVIRRLVTHALDQDPDLQVVGTASNGVIALQRIPQFNPDILTLDIEMPEMDGLETLRRIRREYPHLRVIMFSTLTERGAAVTLEALTLGADDYVAKASNEGSLDRSMARLREELIPKMKQFFYLAGQSRVVARTEMAVAAAAAQVRRSTSFFPGAKVRPKVVVIGVSTGGPTALGAILPELPAGFPLAGFGGAAHAASIHPLARRTSERLVPSARRRGGPGRPGGSEQDSDCAWRLSSEGGFQRRRGASAFGSDRRRKTPAAPPSTRSLLRSERCMAAR